MPKILFILLVFLAFSCVWQEKEVVEKEVEEIELTHLEKVERRVDEINTRLSDYKLNHLTEGSNENGSWKVEAYYFGWEKMLIDEKIILSDLKIENKYYFYNEFLGKYVQKTTSNEENTLIIFFDFEGIIKIIENGNELELGTLQTEKLYSKLDDKLKDILDRNELSVIYDNHLLRKSNLYLNLNEYE